MDDKEIAQGNIGTVGKYDVAFKDGQLVMEMDATYGVGSTGLIQKVSAKEVLEALKKAIPGTVDDAVFNVIEAALGLQ